MLERISLLALVLSAVACGNASDSARPATPSLSDPAHAAVDPMSPGASAMPAVTADPAAANAGGEKAPRARKPFPIHNQCARVVTVVFGEDPKAADAGRRTIAPEATIDGPRDSEGKQTVRILDEKGEVLPVVVHITRGMKQLEIGRSCTTLDAH